MYCLPSDPLPGNRAESLNTPQSLAALRELGDAMVPDCPPSVGLSNMQVIVMMADGMPLAVSANHTHMPDLSAAMVLLGQVGVRVIGYVTDRSESRRQPYGYKRG